MDKNQLKREFDNLFEKCRTSSQINNLHNRIYAMLRTSVKNRRSELSSEVPYDLESFFYDDEIPDYPITADTFNSVKYAYYDEIETRSF